MASRRHRPTPLLHDVRQASAVNTCPHNKKQAGFAYLCQRCREDSEYVAALDAELEQEINPSRLAEVYKLEDT